MSISWEIERQFMQGEQKKEERDIQIKKQQEADATMIQQCTKRPRPQLKTVTKNQYADEFPKERGIILESRYDRNFFFPVYEESDLKFSSLERHESRPNKTKDEDIDTDEEVRYTGWAYNFKNLCDATNRELLTKRFNPKNYHPAF